jgi:hypothetical protein
MAVENATYISQLVSADPLQTDPVAQGYLQLELIKSVLLASFPQISSAVTATPLQLNALEALLGANPGASLTISAGSGDPVVTLTATASGYEIAVEPAGATSPVTSLTVDGSGNVDAPVSLNSTIIKENGNQLLPKGVILLWSGAATAIPAGWNLCDGTNGTIDLRGLFIVGAGNTQVGAVYGPGATGGVNTQNVTTQTAGSHNHGGSTGSGGGAVINGQTASAGAHSHGGQTGSTTLTSNQLPSFTYQYPVYAPQNAGGSGNNFGGATGGDSEIYWHFVNGTITNGGAGHVHSISTDGDHVHSVSFTLSTFTLPISYDGVHSHTLSFDNRPPFYALCYIQKVT